MGFIHIPFILVCCVVLFGCGNTNSENSKTLITNSGASDRFTGLSQHAADTIHKIAPGATGNILAGVSGAVISEGKLVVDAAIAKMNHKEPQEEEDTENDELSFGGKLKQRIRNIFGKNHHIIDQVESNAKELMNDVKNFMKTESTEVIEAASAVQSAATGVITHSTGTIRSLENSATSAIGHISESSRQLEAAAANTATRIADSARRIENTAEEVINSGVDSAMSRGGNLATGGANRAITRGVDDAARAVGNASSVVTATDVVTTRTV